MSKTALLLNASQWCADREAAEQLTRLNRMIIDATSKKPNFDDSSENGEHAISTDCKIQQSMNGVSFAESSAAITGTRPLVDSPSVDDSISSGDREAYKLLTDLAAIASKECKQIYCDDPTLLLVSIKRMKNARPRSQSNPEGMLKSATWNEPSIDAKSSKKKSHFESIDEEMDFEGEIEASVRDSSEAGKEDSSFMGAFPHVLQRYADTYNRNGRIGIYTKEEREAIIERYKAKKQRRIWKKKIRYNCRKNLADKRMRVKGRFVKMSTAQRAALQLQIQSQCSPDCTKNEDSSIHQEMSVDAADEPNQSMSSISDEEEDKLDELKRVPTPHAESTIRRLRRHSIAY